MINKRIYITKLDYIEVTKLLKPNHLKHNIEKRKNSHCIYFLNGVSIRILPLQNGTKITITKRPNRNNIQHFISAINFLEEKLEENYITLKNYGEFEYGNIRIAED